MAGSNANSNANSNASDTNTTTEAPVSPTKRISLPEEEEFTGILLSAEEIEAKGTKLVLITVQDINNKQHVISTSPKYWKMVGKSLTLDSIVKVAAEVRIKDKTGYVMEGSAELVPHASDGINLTRISRSSQSMFERQLALDLENTRMEKALSTLDAAEAAKAQAYATLFSGFFQK